MRKHLLLAEFLTLPLALLPEGILVAYSVLARWDAGLPPSPAARAKVDEDTSARAALLEEMAGQASGEVAILPLMGILTQHPVEDVSGPGATSTDRWAGQFQALVDSPSVGKIIVPIDSPGGSVFGIQEAADLIFAARGIKPVIGIANSMSASAAYWLGSQMSELHITPGGEVGSIGVRSALMSIAEQLKADGIDIRTVAAGKFKTEGDPTQPINEEAIANLQSRINDYYKQFVDSVARGRDVKTTAVKNGMGQGRMLGADAALAENMVDGIATFRQLMARHTGNADPSKPSTPPRRMRNRAQALALLSAGGRTV